MQAIPLSPGDVPLGANKDGHPRATSNAAAPASPGPPHEEMPSSVPDEEPLRHVRFAQLPPGQYRSVPHEW